MFVVRPFAARLLAAVAASLIGSSIASAGPIPWEYSSAIQPSETYPLWSQIQATGGGSHSGEPGTYYSTVAQVSRTPLNMQGTWFQLHHFDLAFTITDTMSGQSGTLTFDGEAFEAQVPFFPRTRTTFVTGIDGESEQTLDFGDRLYHVELRTRRGPQGSTYIDTIVTIETPEPASLAMAGLGLASVMGLRLRRRV